MFLENRENSFFKNRKITVGDIRLFTEKNCISPEEKNCLIAMYDSQIRFVDSAVRDILATLKERKIYEETLVVVTADHGEEFWDHNNFEHGHSLYDELIHVPLIIAGNKAGNPEIYKQVNLVDIMPTILDTARISIDTLDLQGRHLYKPGSRPVFSMGSLYGDEKYCYIKDKMKIIFNSGNKKGKKGLEGSRSAEEFELYNLQDDPVETVNLRNEKTAVFLSLKKELQELMRSGSAGLKGKKLQIDKDEKLEKQLESLGYL
jgi:arylsulfatase A-like enzyme